VRNRKTVLEQDTDWKAVGREWRALVRNRMAQVRAWAQQQGWQVAEQSVSIEEAPPGRYRLPLLTIDLPDSRIPKRNRPSSSPERPSSWRLVMRGAR